MYASEYILRERVGNNALYTHSPEYHSLTIPQITTGTIKDVVLGNDIVFIHEENGKVLPCQGLKKFIRTEVSSTPCIIVDNHNHVLYFWYEALFSGIIERNATLIHIDEHSDLWENSFSIPEVDNRTPSYSLRTLWQFTNFSCNVGNYIQPAIRDGLIRTLIRIEGAYAMENMSMQGVETNTIVNLDLDFFAPELDYIDYNQKKAFILSCMSKVRLITIATSPGFMDQKRAIAILQDIFE